MFIKKLNHSIKRFWENIGRWFSYFKITRKIYDFDYGSILEVEKFQMIRVRNNIVKYQNHKCWKYDVDRINLAIKLIDIILENGCTTCELDKNNLFDFKCEWYLPVYVNTRNANRFIKNSYQLNNPNLKVLVMDSLRIEKAWRLYHKLRVYNLRKWWI